MANLVTFVLITLGVVTVIAGVVSLVWRHRIAQNMVRADVIRGFRSSAVAFVVLVGVMQLALGSLFLFSSAVIPQRVGGLEKIDASEGVPHLDMVQ